MLQLRQMKYKTLFTLLYMVATTIPALAQKTDTLRFYSEAFKSEREIYVTTPEFFKYQSADIRLPVIYILDAQHEWFVNPVKNSIRYLQYTHQIPQAIVVSIPHLNRNQECGIKNIDGALMPLHTFITREVDRTIESYRPNQFKMLIGHSFSASFALYAFLKSPDYFDAVIANTPLDSFKDLIVRLEKSTTVDKKKIFISVGGVEQNQDFYHRKAFEKLREESPDFFQSVNTFTAEHTGHNAVPILATPNFLTKLFAGFNGRYAGIAAVDNHYKLIELPKSLKGEQGKVEAASRLGRHFYLPEISELNGIASRYWNSDLPEYAIAIYEAGTKYYPAYFEFHVQLYELFLPKDMDRAKSHLMKAQALLMEVEQDHPERAELLAQIAAERNKQGW